MCPLRYAFEQETKENSLREGQRLESEAQNLQPYLDISSGKEIAFACLPTMVDGKTKFIWSQTTTSLCNCYVCGAKPSELSLRNGNFVADPKALNFGFSNLHVKLRGFEWICKTSMYRDFKQYKCMAKNEHYKNARKEELKADFYRVFKRKIYAGKPNNGNVARAAFARPDLFSEVTGVPEFIIKGIKTAIDAIDCPQKISPEKYDIFANKWLDDFHASDWKWSWLSPTVHMLFHHGAAILRTLPISPSLLTGHLQIYQNLNSPIQSNASTKIDFTSIKIIQSNNNFP